MAEHKHVGDKQSARMPYSQVEAGIGEDATSYRDHKFPAFSVDKTSRYIHEGNIIRLGRLFGRDFVILRGMYFISPMAVMLTIMVVNGAYLYFFGAYLTTKLLLSVIGAGLCLFLCVLLVFTLDPGYVVRPVPVEQEDHEAPSTPRQYYCRKCFTFQEDRVTHDSFADLCVEGHDHFCVVLGNVIGGKNIVFFYSIFLFYVTNVLMLVLGMINSGGDSKTS